VFGVIGVYILFRSFAASPPSNIAYGDLDGDGVVNSADLTILQRDYGTTATEADINVDGKVSIVDLSILLNHFGSSVPPSDGSYYVDPDGSDSNTGQLGSPWQHVQHAIDSVPVGSTIKLDTGTYSSFVISKNVTITNASGASPIIQGQSGVQDIIRITASGATLSNLDVTGCVPNEFPSGGNLENFGSTGVRINDGASGVTVSGMKIHDSHGTSSEGLPIGCYAMMVHSANNATITNNNMYHNGYGVFIIGGGQNVKVLNNTIHDNDVIIRNTLNVTPKEDYGAVAIGFDNLSPSPGPIAQGNTIYTNVGSSHDYTTDGGGIEVFNASNLTVDSNTFINNENVLEAGTNGGNCSSNKFTNNHIQGTHVTGYPVLDSAHGFPHGSVGMYLRCNANMLISGNNFTNISSWVFDVTQDGRYQGSISGLNISNNTVNQTADKIWAMQVDPSGQSFIINNNHYHEPVKFGDGWQSPPQNWPHLSDWQNETGFDLQSDTF
jgi:parallel beta-helix repeat protein